jgi:uncharacterized protein (DUF849 family)
MANKIIISCAITGSIHTPTMSDALPITPDQIATQAIDAAKAGAAILHLHARDPKDGRPSPDPKVFMQFLPRIKQATDAVVNITTGGAVTMTVEQRISAAQHAVAGNVLAQHGIDELRALSHGEALQELEIRLGGKLSHQLRRLHLSQHVSRHRKDLQYARRRPRRQIRARVLRHRPPLQSRPLHRPRHVQAAGFRAAHLRHSRRHRPELDNLLFMKRTADRLFGDQYCGRCSPAAAIR